VAGSSWTNQVVNLVLVAGQAGTITGVFVYSGTPGAGNPPVFWMSFSDEDPYGNAITPGVFAGQPGSAQVGMVLSTLAGILRFPVPGSLKDYAAAYASGTQFIIEGPQDAVDQDRVYFVLSAGSGGSSAICYLVYLDGNGGVNTQLESSYAGLALPAASIAAVEPGTGTSPTNPAAQETWHTLSPANSWANVASNVPLEYRLMPDNSVWIMGTLNGASATSAVIGTLPSGYRPATQQAFIIGTNAGGAAASDRILQISTAGVMTILDISGGPSIAGDAFINGRISLDA